MSDGRIESIPVTDVKRGDVILLDDGWTSTITSINKARVGYALGPTWGDAVHLVGRVGIVRFTTEYVRVLRGAQ